MSERVRFAKTGIDVSPISYGTWQLSPKYWGDQDEEQIIAAVRRAHELGVNLFDTAGAYGDGLAETVLGKAISELPRDELVICTKLCWHFHPDGRRYADLSREYIIRYAEEAMGRMGVDCIDILLCHSYEPLTPPEEIVDGMETLVKQGKIRAYGVSNWTVEQIRLGISAGGNFAVCQPFYSLLRRDIESDVLPFCQANDIGVMVFSPLHRGLLTGKYKGGETFSDHRADRPEFQGERFKAACDAVAKVGEIGAAYGLTTVQTVLAATVMHPGIHTAIVGVKVPAHIEEAAGAMGKVLSREDYFKVRNLLAV